MPREARRKAGSRLDKACRERSATGVEVACDPAVLEPGQETPTGEFGRTNLAAGRDPGVSASVPCLSPSPVSLRSGHAHGMTSARSGQPGTAGLVTLSWRVGPPRTLDAVSG